MTMASREAGSKDIVICMMIAAIVPNIERRARKDGLSTGSVMASEHKGQALPSATPCCAVQLPMGLLGDQHRPRNASVTRLKEIPAIQTILRRLTAIDDRVDVNNLAVSAGRDASMDKHYLTPHRTRHRISTTRPSSPLLLCAHRKVSRNQQSD